MKFGIAINRVVQEERFETMEDAVFEARSLRMMFGGRVRVQPVDVEKFLAR